MKPRRLLRLVLKITALQVLVACVLITVFAFVEGRQTVSGRKVSLDTGNALREWALPGNAGNIDYPVLALRMEGYEWVAQSPALSMSVQLSALEGIRFLACAVLEKGFDLFGLNRRAPVWMHPGLMVDAGSFHASSGADVLMRLDRSLRTDRIDIVKTPANEKAAQDVYDILTALPGHPPVRLVVEK